MPWQSPMVDVFHTRAPVVAFIKIASFDDVAGGCVTAAADEDLAARAGRQRDDLLAVVLRRTGRRRCRPEGAR